jgi:dihydrodipicolinate synthase/N-acetylneuraminate lyase
MYKEIAKHLVVPIPPSVHNGNALNAQATSDYIWWLHSQGIRCIMTTAGTSQFNLLHEAQIEFLNIICRERFPEYKILGVPPYNLNHAVQFIQRHQRNYPPDNKTSLLLLYPDRYYNDADIMRYFYTLADVSQCPVIIHGMFMRDGRSGLYDYKASLLNKILAHENIIGIKEENSNLGKAYNVCQEVDTDNNVVIVAGGSMRRWNALRTTGVQTWLAGVGNMFPQAELSFRANTKNFDIIENFENPMFEVFMSIGWHMALRYALSKLKLGCDINIPPFPAPTLHETDRIDDLLQGLKKQCLKYGFSDHAELTIKTPISKSVEDCIMNHNYNM